MKRSSKTKSDDDHHESSSTSISTTTKTSAPTKKTITVKNKNSSSSLDIFNPTSIFNFIVKTLNDSNNFKWFALIFLVADVLINYLVVTKIPYTEIDWSTYMQQITLFKNGERDYTKLEGDTGPVVYPAGFIYVFSILRDFTDEGFNIARAQAIFAGLAVVVSAVVFAIYRRAGAPGYILIFLILSKRIHSIFGLRLFNDGLTMLVFYVALYLFTRHQWSLGCFLFSIAVGIKMNVLLFAPGLLLLLLQTYGVVGTIPRLAICGVVQLLLGAPFLAEYPVSYLTRAFEFSRQFMYKWTVNWRFVPEDIFLSKPWALGLLGCHLLFLCIFIFYKWYANKNNNCPIQFSQKKPRHLSPKYIVTVMFTANLIGITFSRSLHYQFYVWYFHSLPFLLWQTRLPVFVRVILLGAIEYCWNVYPSTSFSSILLVSSNLLIVLSLLFSSTASPSPLSDNNHNNSGNKHHNKIK